MKQERLASVLFALSQLVVAVVVAASPTRASAILPPVAASPTEARRLNAAADAEFETGLSYAGSDVPRAAAMIRRAAFLYWEAAEELPETHAHRGIRGDLFGKALSAYRQAQQLRPDRRNLEDSLRIVRAYSDALRAAYGDSAASLPEYERAQSYEPALRREFAAYAPAPGTTAPGYTEAERPGGAPAGATLAADAPAPAATAPGGTGAERPSHTPTGVADRPRVITSTRPIDATRSHGTRRLTIGLSISAGLAGAAGVASLATGLSVVSDPFRGTKYRAIVEAAAAANLDVPGKTDYCAFGRAQGAEGVVSACDAYQATRRASLAMGITAGAAIVSAVTFGVLLARARRAEARSRTLQVGLAPSQFGAELRVMVGF